MGQWTMLPYNRSTIPHDSARSGNRYSSSHCHQVSPGCKEMIYITVLTSTSGDRPLTDALQLMSNEGLTSVAVVDNASNVVGNISTADVKLLTNTSSLPLLKSSCIHFISVILSERGIGDGKDPFPGKFSQQSITLRY